MDHTIFYSWQSDLPSKRNLNFIEKEIKKSIKHLATIKPISIKLKFDKATRNVSGAPDIADTIFSKIVNSNVFIADISIINNKYNRKRKTPNPNVLLELGYAAKSLGWDKIICVFNSDTGNIKDIPFDLRNRRMMVYSGKNTETTLSEQISFAIKEMHKKGILTDKIFDFLKTEIDQEIIELYSHIIRICPTKNLETKSFLGIDEFLSLTEQNIIDNLKNEKFLGFHLLKIYDESKTKIYKHVNQAMSSQYYNREVLNALIDIYNWFDMYESFRNKYFFSMINCLDEKESNYTAIKGSDFSNDGNYPNRYLLLNKTGDNEGQVIGHGDFATGAIDTLTNYYSLNEEYLGYFARTIRILIKSIKNWLKCSNNEFIIDFVNQFRAKTTNGEWIEGKVRMAISQK